MREIISGLKLTMTTYIKCASSFEATCAKRGDEHTQLTHSNI